MKAICVVLLVFPLPISAQTKDGWQERAEKMKRGEVDRDGNPIPKKTDAELAAMIGKAMAANAEKTRQAQEARFNQEKAESIAAANARYPDILIPFSPFRKALGLKILEAKARQDPILKDPRFYHIFATQVAMEQMRSGMMVNINWKMVRGRNPRQGDDPVTFEFEPITPEPKITASTKSLKDRIEELEDRLDDQELTDMIEEGRKADEALSEE